MKLPVNYEKLSAEERRQVREEYIALQKGRCLFCNEKLLDDPVEYVQNALIDESLFPKGFFQNKEHLHHDHDTGMTIGTVHARCKAYLWQFLGE
jgi:hypothetical protein